jgi:hypothetical protein
MTRTFSQAVDSPDYNGDLDVGKEERDASLPGLDVSILKAGLAIVMSSGRPQKAWSKSPRPTCP